jgi:hypothetical protein
MQKIATGFLTYPKVQDKMNYKIGVAGILRLENMTGPRMIIPKDTDNLKGILKGCPYTQIRDITGLSGYKNRHIFKSTSVLVDPAGIMRGPGLKGEILEKKKPVKRVGEKIPRENKLKTMNTSRIKGLIYAAVNTFRYRFKKMRMPFFTVSFPPSVNVKMAKRFLNIWLTKLRKAGKIFMYLWVMEFQKNGTAHFHLLIPGAMNVRYANRMMQETLTNAVLKKELNWTIQAAAKYNGVDIAKDRKTKRVTDFADPLKAPILIKYISKYITKNNAPTEFQRWHCSREWSNLCTGVALTENEAEKFLHLVDYEDRIENEFFSFYRWKPGGPPESLLKYLAGINYFFLNHFFLIEGDIIRERPGASLSQNLN